MIHRKLSRATPDEKLSFGGALGVAPCTIPRIIHQTYPSYDLPAAFAAVVAELKRANPGWEHRLYDDAAIETFIAASYGAEMLACYRRIDPVYGAARADFFRYLLIYKVGGVYLDIKSSFDGPIDDVIDQHDCYLIARWHNAAGQCYAGFGLHSELAGVPGGEIQQWHVIAAPGHPFLKAVIERVLANIAAYRPWRQGTGKPAVLRLTGPIAYTLAIEPLLEHYPHRSASDETALRLRYSALGPKGHRSLFSAHYTEQARPLVRLGLPARIFYGCYRAARGGSRRAWRWLADPRGRAAR